MSERTVRVGLDERAYDVRIGTGMIARLGELMGTLDTFSRVVVVTNATVRELYGAALLDALESGPAAGVPKTVVEIGDGEQHKTVATLEAVYDGLLDVGADRKSVVVALGGGVVGDVSGFAAATVLRGIRLVMVPTTLLAQVDSSVGGKTGVNRPQGKNLVGAFHQPVLVAADTDVFATLPEREYRAGLAEVVKYGVILDEELLTLLETRAEAVARRDADVLTEIVARSVELKAWVVERDEREGDLRRILNFGHTVGHAIEQATGYRSYLHGEAVAMGMGAAMRISERLGACTTADVERIERLLVQLGLGASVPADIGTEALISAISSDKKVEQESVHFIVAEGLGRCRQQRLTPAEIVAAL